MDIKGLMRRAYLINKSNGWWPNDVINRTNEHNAETWISRLALVGTEVSEAIEDIRNGHFDEATAGGAVMKPIGLPSELADICIRVFDMAEQAGIDLEGAIVRKLDYNSKRPRRHGDKAP